MSADEGKVIYIKQVIRDWTTANSMIRDTVFCFCFEIVFFLLFYLFVLVFVSGDSM